MGFQNVEAALHFRVYQWGPQFCHQWELSKNGGRGKETIGNQPKIAGHLVNRRVPVKLASMDSIANGPAVVDLLVITVGVPMVETPKMEDAATTAGIGGLFVSSVSTQNVSVYRQGQVHFGVDQRKDANVVTLLWVLAVVLWIPSKVDNCSHNWPS